jgi:DNA-directed RNA polymerase specialized sigma24 family protein
MRRRTAKEAAMKTVNMAEVMAEVGQAIKFYGFEVSKKCGMDGADARQELMIAAWQSAQSYRKHTHECARKQWVMADISYKAKKIVFLQNRRKAVESRIYPKIFPLLSTVSPDHADSIISKIDMDDRIAGLNPVFRTMATLARTGMNRKEVGEAMGYNEGWISWKLKH